MGKYAKTFTLLIFFMSNSCIGADKGPVYLNYVHEISNEFVREMEKEYGLVCTGSGGSMPRDVEEITLFFHSYRKSTIPEARELLIKTTDRLIQKVNAHEKIRPFLHQYPFTRQGARVSIWFHNPKNGSYYLDGSVAFVCQAKGDLISYDRAELQTRQSNGFQDLDGNHTPGKSREMEVMVLIMEEPYEEGLRIFNSKQIASKKQ